MKQNYKKYIIQNQTEESLKTRIIFFKNNYSDNLKLLAAKNKILLSYDDRTDAFYLFSNFTTQYVIYIKNNDSLTLTIFKANKDLDSASHIYISELLSYMSLEDTTNLSSEV